MRDDLSFSGLHALANRLRCIPRGAAQFTIGPADGLIAKRDAEPASAADPKTKSRRDSEERDLFCCMKLLSYHFAYERDTSEIASWSLPGALPPRFPTPESSFTYLLFGHLLHTGRRWSRRD